MHYTVFFSCALIYQGSPCKNELYFWHCRISKWQVRLLVASFHFLPVSLYFRGWKGKIIRHIKVNVNKIVVQYWLKTSKLQWNLKNKKRLKRAKIFVPKLCNMVEMKTLIPIKSHKFHGFTLYFKILPIISLIICY